MNRIYQGRVSRVQRLVSQPAGIKPSKSHGSKSDDWCEWPGGEEALWQHHELFQDAVNYYLVTLLAGATSPENPLFEIRQRIASDDAEYQIWTSFRRRGVNRRGLQESVAKYLTPDNPAPTWSEAVQAVLGSDCADADVIAAAIQELLAICDGGGAIQQEGRAMFPRFCAHDYAGGYPLDAAAGVRESVEALLVGEFHDITDESALAEFAKLRLHIGGVVNLAHDRPPFAGESARERLLKAVDHFRQVWDPKAAATKMGDRVRVHLSGIADACFTFEALRKDIVEMPATALPEIPANQRSIPDRLEAALLFKYFPRHFTAELLRVSFPRAKVRKTRPKEVIDGEKAWDKFKRVVASRFSDDPIKLARGKRGYVFRAFTSLRAWNSTDTPAPQWREFDIAAFKYALTALNQIEDRGNERRKEQLGKQSRLDFMRGDGSAPYRPTSETDEAPPRIKGDPRIERLEAVLIGLRDVHWMTEGEVSDYGLQPRTIRGFRDLRRLWRREAGLDRFSEALQERLRRILHAFQSDNATTIGSVRLFEALLESDSWIVWQEQADEIAAAWVANGFAEDPLEALVEERELREEIERLGRPVRLTPADPLHSRRQYDFNAVSGFKAKGTCRHEPGVLAFTTEIAARAEEGWQTVRARIVYSAPRFLRDGLRSDSAETLAESRWLQPMMEALVPTPGLSQNLTECAVCLMPDVPASGQRRLLLNFPVTLEPAALQAQLGRLEKWKGQLYGGDKEPLALRWKEDDWPESQIQPRWYHRLDEFHVMSVDLGQRDAGAFAVLHCTKGKPTRPIHRTIGSTEDEAWFASVIETGLLRLPGEDARVWRDGRWQEELSGKAGRLATAREWEEACQICGDLRLEAKAWLGDDPKKNSFPELNDRLLAVLRRAQAHLARLQSWSWRCVEPAAGGDCRREILEFDGDPDNLKPLAAEHAPVANLQPAIVNACTAQ
ncbi:MAG TPA: type V CRISPR-associated protein Cas12b, partial [Opitutus sp.]|nr:type V CRISPR-associated protein Cas12b [Opitutus sp.]